MSAADRALLHEHLVTRRADYARFLMRWAVIMTLAWWFTDPVLLRRVPGGVAAFAGMRASALVGCLAAMWILRGARALEAASRPAPSSGWPSPRAWPRASTLGDFSTFWFHGLYPVVIVTAFFPFELKARALFAAAIAASILGGFVLARPGAASPPFFGPTVGYMVFTVGVAVTFGHMYFLVTCEAFRQRLTVDAQREDLRRQVDLRTDELRRLAAHLDRVSEEERRRIARELHDELGQSVSALRVSLATARRRFERDPASIGANLGDLDELARRVSDSARDALTHLRPRVLDDLGLAAAARWLAQSVDARGDLAVTLTVEGDEPAVPTDAEGRGVDEVSVAAFRVLQEALTNAARHARATRAEVTLRFGDAVELTVDDDGVGPGEGAPGRGLGVLGMRERARALGGSFSIEPRPGGGTRVTCALPRRAEGAAA
ncbi:MAG: histidine kinase [Polyangiales bacterium]